MIRSGTAACAAALLLCIACRGDEGIARGGLDEPPADTTVTLQGSDSLRVHIETVAHGLEVPWDMAFTPDGRILVTERPGRIRVIEDGALRAEPWAQLEVFGEEPVLLPESGLMGIALSPDYPETGHVFVMATVRKTGNSPLAIFYQRVVRRVRRAIGLDNESLYESHVYRFTDRGHQGTDRVTVVTGLPANYYHAGGAVRFGPDDLLYFTVGDVLESPGAQDPGTRTGAILRIRADGTVPPDNPIPGSPVFAWGLRNSQGMVWDSASGVMLAIDHGPTFLPHEDGRYGHDELNVIVPGGNYGWPAEAGRVDEPQHTPPLIDWVTAHAPAGLALYQDTLFSDWTGSLLVTGLRGQQLRRVTLERDGDTLATRTDEIILDGLGRIRAVNVAPDGSVFITTSNHDGRGVPDAFGDRLLRLTPAP